MRRFPGRRAHVLISAWIARTNDVRGQERVSQPRLAVIEEQDQQADDDQIGLRRVISERVILETGESDRA